MKKNIIIIAALTCAVTPSEINVKNSKTKTVEPEQNFDKVVFDWTRNFAHILHLAKEKHFKIPNPEKSMIKAIDAFLNELDPHSSFLDPKTYKAMLESTSGEFFGVGIVIDNTRKTKDKFLTIVDTIPDGPADKEGILPMDKIVEISGKSLDGMTTEEIITKIKGERNSKVDMKVMRDTHQDLLSFGITRDIVKEQSSLSFFIKDQNISYLSLTTFSENATAQIKNLLNKANEKKYKGLILDLRNNSGGLLNTAIDIASLFLDKKSLVVITKNKGDSEIAKYHTSNNPVADNSIPIFVLVNNYTASAAEILAGCLKIHSQNNANQSNNKKQKLNVFLAGTKTFGKGSVQEVMPVNNNCAIKLTTSLYYLPNDTTIQGVGIEPDFVIEKKFPPTKHAQWFTQFYGHENSFDNHIKVTKNENEKDKKKKEKDDKDKTASQRWSDRAKKMLQSDNQLRETISLINMLHQGYGVCPDNVCTRDKAVAFLNKTYITNETLDIEEVKA